MEARFSSAVVCLRWVARLWGKLHFCGDGDGIVEGQGRHAYSSLLSFGAEGCFWVWLFPRQMG